MLKELTDVLRAAAGVSALVGARVYAARLPASPAYPCVVVDRITGRGEVSHSGPLATRMWRVRLAVYGSSLDEEERVLEACRTVLHGQRMIKGSVSFEGFDVNEGPNVWEDELNIHGSSSDVEVNWCSV